MVKFGIVSATWSFSAQSLLGRIILTMVIFGTILATWSKFGIVYALAKFGMKYATLAKFGMKYAMVKFGTTLAWPIFPKFGLKHLVNRLEFSQNQPVCNERRRQCNKTSKWSFLRLNARSKASLIRLKNGLYAVWSTIASSYAWPILCTFYAISVGSALSVGSLCILLLILVQNNKSLCDYIDEEKSDFVRLYRRRKREDRLPL